MKYKGKIMKELKKGDSRALINHEEEVKALTKYIKENWDGVDSITSASSNQPSFYEFVAFIYLQAINDSLGWFDLHEISYETINEIAEERKNLLESKSFEGVYLCDSFHRTMSSFGHSLYDIDRASKGYPHWQFSEQVNQTFLETKKHFKNTENESIGPSYEGNKNVKKDFEGHNSSGVVSFNFVNNISFESISYNENEQGLNRHRSLVAAIYSHALGISENNNTFFIKETIRQFADTYEKTQINGENIDLSILKKNPILQLALKIIEFNSNAKETPEKEYSYDEITSMNNDYKKEKKSFENKTDKEKKIIRKEKDKRVVSSMEDIFKELKDEEINELANKKTKDEFIKLEFRKIINKKKNISVRNNKSFRM